MSSEFIIRRILAGLLLFVFALANAPKQLLHDAIATHKHQCTSPTQELQFTKSKFNCNCENLTAEGPFLDLAEAISIIPLMDYAEYHSHYLAFPDLSHTRFFGLRGPPAC